MRNIIFTVADLIGEVIKTPTPSHPPLFHLPKQMPFQSFFITNREEIIIIISIYTEYFILAPQVQNII